MGALTWHTVPSWSLDVVEALAAKVGIEVMASGVPVKVDFAEDGLLVASVATLTVRDLDGRRRAWILAGATPNQRRLALALAVSTVEELPTTAGAWQHRDGAAGPYWTTAIAVAVDPDDLTATLDAAAAPRPASQPQEAT